MKSGNTKYVLILSGLILFFGVFFKSKSWMPDDRELRTKNYDEVVTLNTKIIQRLDEIVTQKRYTDRSELLRSVVEKYLAFGDEFYAKELPVIVKILVKDTLSEYPENFSKLLQFTLNMVQENTALLQKMDRIFEGDNGIL